MSLIRYDETKIDHIRYLLSALKKTRTARDNLTKATKSNVGLLEFSLNEYKREEKPLKEGECRVYGGYPERYRPIQLFEMNTENAAHLLMPILVGRIRAIETELVSLNVELPAEK